MERMSNAQMGNELEQANKKLIILKSKRVKTMKDIKAITEIETMNNMVGYYP